MPGVQLGRGVVMPMIGYGTWQVKDPKILETCLDAALKCGYRFIDTAIAYENEETIGKILQDLLPKHGLTRKDIFITSKLPPSEQGKATEAVGESLRKLRTDYIDLFLIHWPGSSGKPDHSKKDKRNESWKQLEACVESGQLRAIGVSNYEVKHLEPMLSNKIKPAVNQCEFHPHYATIDLKDWCNRNGIHFQAYSSLGSPLAHGALLKEPIVVELATEYKCTPGQLLLAWALCQGVSVLPRSTKPDRVVENWGATHVQFKAQDVERLTKLSSKKYCWDPKTID